MSWQRALASLVLAPLAAGMTAACGIDTGTGYGEWADGVGGKADTVACEEGDAACGEWEEVAPGIGYRHAGSGDGVLLGYGGYGVALEQAQAWVDALHAARLADLEVGHLFAFKGPADALYSSRELLNSRVADRVVRDHAGAGRIVIAAHSSGSFVAHELLGALERRDAGLLGRVAYFNLDGGRNGLTDSIVSSLGLIRFVYARDPQMADNDGLSRNGWYARGYAEGWSAQGAAALEVDASGSGCETRNCLHDALITTHPHSRTTFDVALDYTDFSDGREVVTAYLDAVE